jgi:Sec-independent protein translocase protein TatA
VAEVDMYGLMDLVVILVILVIVFGAKWLPATGEAIGRSIVRRRQKGSGLEAQGSGDVRPEGEPPKP